MKILKFTFSAPLQSWGEDARWDNRSTAICPTKSGIIGFLGCCFGYPRGDKRLNVLNDGLLIAVRTDNPGQILTDFQTVRGTDGKFISAEGKPRTGGGTIITPKQYLQGAVFTVFLRGEYVLLEQCWKALKHPFWTPYLGRKNCVPSIPIIPKWVEAESLNIAVRIFDKDELLYCGQNVTVEMDYDEKEESATEERTYFRYDSVLHAERNEYVLRRVKSFIVPAGGDNL